MCQNSLPPNPVQNSEGVNVRSPHIVYRPNHPDSLAVGLLLKEKIKNIKIETNCRAIIDRHSLLVELIISQWLIV